jgi:hypothetical protein
MTTLVKNGTVMLGLAALSFACTAAEDGPLTVTVLPACLKLETPHEAVFRTAEEWTRFLAAHAGGDGGGAVDFSRSMVAAHFDGTGAACVGFTVESVSASDGMIVVRATRHSSPNPCIAVVAYPQLVLVLPRRDDAVVFRIADARDEAAVQIHACR